MIIGLLVNQEYNKNSQERDQNLSAQLDELNSNVVKLIPKEPKIEITAIAQKDFPGRDLQLYEEIGLLKCERNILIPIENDQNYERVIVWFENKGKKTTDLRAEIECSPNSFIMAFCVSSENAEIETDNNVDIEGIVRINELDLITSESVEVFYQLKEENKSTCSVTYDSFDFSEGESQTIDINYYSYHF